jgi:hypothetical protein
MQPGSTASPFATRGSTSSAEFNPFGLDSSTSSVEMLFGKPAQSKPIAAAQPAAASSVAKPKGITRNPFLQSMVCTLNSDKFFLARVISLMTRPAIVAES